jgi:putative oxidoreductase
MEKCQMMSSNNGWVLLIGRTLLAAIFLWSGFGKVMAYAGTTGYMENFGVPGAILPAAIALELVGGLLLLIGWRTREVALILAAFCVVSALIFHTDFADRNQMIHFMKNLSMAGGFLALFVAGAGAISADARRA